MRLVDISLWERGKKGDIIYVSDVVLLAASSTLARQEINQLRDGGRRGNAKLLVARAGIMDLELELYYAMIIRGACFYCNDDLSYEARVPLERGTVL